MRFGDLNGKTLVVIGGTTGLGLSAARARTVGSAVLDAFGDTLKALISETSRGEFPALESGLKDPPDDPVGRQAPGRLERDHVLLGGRAEVPDDRGLVARAGQEVLQHTDVVAAGKESWKRKQYPVMTQNALRQLIAVSPELQTA